MLLSLRENLYKLSRRKAQEIYKHSKYGSIDYFYDECNRENHILLTAFKEN
jgi:hypothetical protein